MQKVMGNFPFVPQLLTTRVDRLEQAAECRQGRVLVGEAAYSMDQAAFLYVFRGERRRKISIAEIRMAAFVGELSDAPLKRWGEFSKFLAGKGWAVSDVCSISSSVKELRREDAHASDEDKAKVSLQQLERWVEAHADKSDVDDFTQFVQLAACFGQANKPLLLGKVVELVDKALERKQ